MNKKPVTRIDLSYDGSLFFGYQIQNNFRTVQGELEKALEALYKIPVKTMTAGRTDTGVHAIHQVVSYKVKQELPNRGIKKALNSLLPPDIRIHNVSNESKQFHARFSPHKRTYMYIVYNAEICPPFLRNYVWQVHEKINLKKLKKAAKILVGTHDFKSFCEKSGKENHVRTLHNIKVKKKGEYIYIFVEGNAFLRRMIRCIVGAIVTVSQKQNINEKILSEILEYKNRGKNPFPTAPPTGLYFYKVHLKSKPAQIPHENLAH